MLTSETLYRAADLIEERGWTNKGGWQYANATYTSLPVCLEGGIQAATGHRFKSIGHPPRPAELEALRSCPAYRAVTTYLAIPDGEPLFMWNDAEGRTAAEVVGVLRACAVIEAAKETADERESVSA